MLKNRDFIKEIFENFGYIEIEACEPTELKKYLEDFFHNYGANGQEWGL
jgi:hypothetical protein